MSINFRELLNDDTLSWEKEEGASSDAIEKLRNESTIKLPENYLAFLRFSNGGEGEFGVDPGWFQMWPAEDVLEYHNGYEVPEYLPGFFAFASSGGGDLFVFDTRKGEPYKVLSVPSIGMHELEYSTFIGEDFMDFVKHIGKRWQFDE